MNHGPRRVQLATGFVLHQRPFRDSSLIVEIFTREHGRMSSFARAARGLRSRFHGLRPFQPLLLSWSGRGDAPQLTGAEPDGAPFTLPASQLLSAFYLNELLVRLTAQHDPHPELFDLYAHTLRVLAEPPQAETALRSFERQLLELLGFGIDLQHEAGGQPVEVAAHYRFRAGSGLWRTESIADSYSGRMLLLLADAQPIEDPQLLRQARALMRAAIDHCLEGRELATRRVARSIARLERSA